MRFLWAGWLILAVLFAGGVGIFMDGQAKVSETYYADARILRNDPTAKDDLALGDMFLKEANRRKTLGATLAAFAAFGAIGIYTNTRNGAQRGE